MPFDGRPVIDRETQLPVDVLDFDPSTSAIQPLAARSLPIWHALRRPEGVGATLAVLVRARELIADEGQWCKGAFARSWLDIPVPVRSVFARRYCALGAIARAGRELGFPVEDAESALKRQTVSGIVGWNDAAGCTHAEVIAAFDAAIEALGGRRA
jgi:hypothetical protein